MIQFIEVVRAIATMLIANSHFKGVYQRICCRLVVALD